MKNQNRRQDGPAYCQFKAVVSPFLIDTGIGYGTIDQVFPSFREDQAALIKKHVLVGNTVIFRDPRCSKVGLDKKRGNAFFDEGYTGELVEVGNGKYIVHAAFSERHKENETGGVAINSIASMAEWEKVRKEGQTTRDALQKERREGEKLAQSIFMVVCEGKTRMATLSQLARTFGVLDNEGDTATIVWPENAEFAKLERGRPVSLGKDENKKPVQPIVPDSVVAEILKASKADIKIAGEHRFRIDDSAFKTDKKNPSPTPVAVKTAPPEPVVDQPVSPVESKTDDRKVIEMPPQAPAVPDKDGVVDNRKSKRIPRTARVQPAPKVAQG